MAKQEVIVFNCLWVSRGI